MPKRLEIRQKKMPRLSLVASEPEDIETYAKAVLVRNAADVLIAEFASRLDYPPPAVLPSTAHYLRELKVFVDDAVEESE